MQQYSKQKRCKKGFNPQLFVWINTSLHHRNKAYIAQRIKALNLHEGTLVLRGAAEVFNA